MKRFAIIAAALALSGCATIPPETYADSLYRVARAAGKQAVRLHHLSPERFAELDAKARAILSGIYLGTATVEQLVAVTKEMKR